MVLSVKIMLALGLLSTIILIVLFSTQNKSKSKSKSKSKKQTPVQRHGKKDRLISPREKDQQIFRSMRRLFSSPELQEVEYAEMLVEGMCVKDPVWLTKLIGDIKPGMAMPTWMKKVPHRAHILRWAKDLDRKLKS